MLKNIAIAALMIVAILGDIRYHRLDQKYMQEEGLRDEADSLLRKQATIINELPSAKVYKLNALFVVPNEQPNAPETLTGYEVLSVKCLNGGDPTMDPPSGSDHTIIVSCGN
jgi:hypothetical protein